MSGATGPYSRRRGFVLTEACVSLALVGMVLGMASLMLSQHGRATEYFLNYRRAQLAAASWVERMRIASFDFVDTGFCDLEGLQYQVRVEEAPDDWKPLRLVDVRVLVEGRRARSAQYSLRTYLAVPNASRGNNP